MRSILFLILAFVLQTEARVFNFRDGKFSGYLSATYGTSAIKKDFFEGESSATEYSKGFNTNMGGDFGFIYNSGYVSWLFGFEFIKPTKISGGVASTSGTQNYKYTSDVSVFAPKIGIELILYQSSTFRVFINGAVGTASLTTKTDYTEVSIAPNADFTLEGKGAANLLMGGAGFEWHWTDNTTLVFQASYRDLKFSKVEYAADAASSFQGAQTSGTTMTLADGSNRKLNFTGYYTLLGLRFWLF